MNTTLSALKQALDIISRTTSSAFVKTMLEEAIAREEAQSVEPYAQIVDHEKSTDDAGNDLHYALIYSSASLPVGTNLFTRTATEPTKLPENCGTGHCSCIECEKPAKPSAGERELVISQLRDNGSRLSEVAADMLADDAQLDTESILIDGIAYTIPSPVAYELLDLHLKLKASEQAQPDNPNKEVDLLHKLGNRLAELLDEDQFSECEDILIALEAGPWTLKRAQRVSGPQELEPCYINRLIEALYENSDPVSVEAAEEFQRMLENYELSEDCVCATKSAAEIEQLKSELQRVYDVVTSHAKITFKAEDERDQLKAKNEKLVGALKHLTHNTKKSGANVGLALDVAIQALKENA